MTKQNNLGFHGEVTYTPINKLPDGEIKKLKMSIVGESETHHHHVLECDTEFDQIMTDNGIYIHLYEQAKLYHAKENKIHQPQILEPGTYRFGEKTEYSPITKAIQRVYD